MVRFTHRRAGAFLGLQVLACGLAGAALAAPKVVATVPPIHSLIAGVMEGIGAPALLLPGGASPHTHSLRPSQARALNEADVVFWVGAALETFLKAPLAAYSQAADIVTLSNAPGVETLPLRKAGVIDAVSPDDEAGGALDPHIWLSVANAAAIVDAAVGAVSARDPDNAAAYAANGDALHERLGHLAAELAAHLAPVRNRPYVVFHDAYQYMEREHDLNIVGSITVDPEQRPGARRLAELRNRITDVQAVCVFSEPQFRPELVMTIVDGTDARMDELDPVGAGRTPGPDLYFDMMRHMAASLADCLTGPPE